MPRMFATFRRSWAVPALAALSLAAACQAAPATAPTAPPAAATAVTKAGATTAAVAPTAVSAAAPAATSAAQSAPTVAAAAGTAAAKVAPTVAAAVPTVAAKVGAIPAGRVFTVGISQFVAHPALDATRDGAKQAFADAGFVEGQSIRFDIQNGQRDMATVTQIAQRYRDQKADLVFAVGTQPLQAALQVFRDGGTPIVFAAVADPYGAAKEVIKSPTDKPPYVTGYQALPPVKDAMQLAQKLVPGAKRFGMIWTPSEANSEVATRIARDVSKELNVELVEQTISSADEVQQAAQSLLGKNVDLFFVSTDSTVVSALEALVKVANDNRKPLIGNDPASAARGATAALGLDYFQSGVEGGRVAAQILKGETSPAQVPIARSVAGWLAINTRAAELQGVAIPPDVMRQAKETFDTITPPKKP